MFNKPMEVQDEYDKEFIILILGKITINLKKSKNDIVI